jgi:hypothetical protein
MKLEHSRQIFFKFSNIKFYENPAGGSLFVSCGQTDERRDMAKPIVAFTNLRKRLKCCKTVCKSSTSKGRTVHVVLVRDDVHGSNNKRFVKTFPSLCFLAQISLKWNAVFLCCLSKRSYIGLLVQTKVCLNWFCASDCPIVYSPSLSFLSSSPSRPLSSREMALTDGALLRSQSPSLMSLEQ